MLVIAFEAIQHSNDYFALYRRDMQLGAYQGIAKRIEKARSLIEKEQQASTIGGALKVTKNRSMGGSNKLFPDVRPPEKSPELPAELPFRKDLKVPSDTVDRNLGGLKLEAEGLIDNTIQCYEANVRDGFEGNGPYDRLAVIYRRRGDIEKEIAVLKRAVEVFEKLQTSPRLDVAPKLTKFRERLWRASERLKRSK